MFARTIRSVIWGLLPAVAAVEAQPRTIASPTRAARTFAWTSWTRTMSAPPAMPSAFAARVASRRSSAGSPRTRPRVDFRLTPSRIGRPSRRKRSSPRTTSQVVLGRLAEAEPRVDDQVGPGDAEAEGPFDRALEVGDDLRHERRVARLGPVVHDHQRDAVVDRHLRAFTWRDDWNVDCGASRRSSACVDSRRQHDSLDQAPDGVPVTVCGVARSRAERRFSGRVAAHGLARIRIRRPGTDEAMDLGELPGNDEAYLRSWARYLQQVDPEAYEMTLDDSSIEGWDGEEVMRQIQCPTLLLQASPSLGGMMSDHDVQRACALLAHPVRVRFPTLGHALFIQNPEPILRSVTNFLESLEP